MITAGHLQMVDVNVISLIFQKFFQKSSLNTNLICIYVNIWAFIWPYSQKSKTVITGSDGVFRYNSHREDY